MGQPLQPRKSNASRLWLYVLLVIALALVAPTYFALKWLMSSRSFLDRRVVQPEVVGSFRADYQPEQPKAGWRYLWNANGPLGDTNSYVELRWSGQRYTTDESRYPAAPPAAFLRLSSGGGHPGQGRLQTGQFGENYERALIIAFSVTKNGPYAIRDSFIQTHSDKGGGVHLRVFVNQSEINPDIACQTREQMSFDRDLGELSVGDNIYICVGAGESDEHDSFGVDFTVAIQPQGQIPAFSAAPVNDSQVAATRPTRGSQANGAFSPVPLESFYQRLLNSYGPNDSWGVVPQGVVEFDGIPFHMLGKIEMNGMGASRSGDFKPPRVGEIPVNRRAARLHLIGGAGYKDPDGTPVAELRLHYTNGEQRNIFINYGDHIRNWHVASDEKRTDVSDPRCYIVWNGTHPTTDGPLRLFKTTFDNPLPAQEIRGLEVLSLFGKSYFAFCALTLEEASPAAPAPPPATAEDPEDLSYRRETLVKVIDQATGRAIANATLTLAVNEGDREYGFGRYRTDGLGQVLLDYPPGKFSTVRLQLAAPGYLPLTEMRATADGLLPPELVLKCSAPGAINAPIPAAPPALPPPTPPGKP